MQPNDAREKVSIQKTGEQNRPKKSKISDLVHMSDSELLELKAEIEQLLGAKSLKDLDLEQELLQQFNLTKKLLAEVLEDAEVPANQKAQVVNSCTSILKELTQTQTELYNAERLKKMESALIQCLKTLDKEAQQEFLLGYGHILEEQLSAE